MSLAIVASAVIFASKGIGGGNANFLVQSKALQRNIAIYDIFNELTENVSSNICIGSHDSECLANLTDSYERVYDLKAVSFTLNSPTSGVPTNSTTKCLSMFLQDTNQTGRICVSVGD